jgi:hypothetical protein
MASVNKVILIGNLGKDPETRYLPSGDAVANFQYRHHREVQGQERRAAGAHRVASHFILWAAAEIAGEYLKKGSPVLSKAVSARASGRTRKARIALPPKSLVIACNCWVAAVVRKIGARTGSSQYGRRYLAVVKNVHPRRRAEGSMKWMTIFRFSRVSLAQLGEPLSNDYAYSVPRDHHSIAHMANGFPLLLMTLLRGWRPR